MKHQILILPERAREWSRAVAPVSAHRISAAKGRLRRSVEQQELWGRFVDSNNGTIPRDVRMFAASSPYFAPARPDCSAPSCIQVYLYTNLDKLHKLHLGAARFYEFNVQAVYNYAATMRRVVSLLNNLLRQSV